MLLYPTVSRAQIVIAPQPFINTSGVASGPILFPVQAQPSSVEGKVYYDSTAHSVEYYNGTSWINLTGLVTGGTCTNQAATAISTSGVPTCTTLTSAYVNSSIATISGATILANVTGQAIGDLFAASSTTALSRIADVAAGSLFSSGGIGANPTWTTAPTATTFLTGEGAVATPAFTFSAHTGSGIYSINGVPIIVNSGAASNSFAFGYDAGGVFKMPSGGGLSFSSGADITSGPDTGISRLAANSIVFGNGTPGNATATVRAASYSLAGTTALPADQTGNATATFKMNGLGAAAAPCTITPGATGKVRFTISGILNQTTTADGVTYKLVFGSGTAPANAAAATGTVISAVPVWTALTGMLSVPFSIEATTSGLTVATAYWYDLQIAEVTGGTAAVKTVTCAATEN